MPLGVLYIHALTMPYSNWCIRMPMCVWCVGRIVTYRRGAFGVARFDRQGNAKALTREASDRELAPRFFVYVRFVFNRLISSLWRPSDILR